MRTKIAAVAAALLVSPLVMAASCDDPCAGLTASPGELGLVRDGAEVEREVRGVECELGSDGRYRRDDDSSSFRSKTGPPTTTKTTKPTTTTKPTASR